MRVSPIEASAGKHTRHRLNRGGDRHVNNALWRVAMIATCDSAPTTRVDRWKGNRRRRSSDASNITLLVRSTCCRRSADSSEHRRSSAAPARQGLVHAFRRRSFLRLSDDDLAGGTGHQTELRVRITLPRMTERVTCTGYLTSIGDPNQLQFETDNGRYPLPSRPFRRRRQRRRRRPVAQNPVISWLSFFC